MGNRLGGRRALVTGASRGIGASTARRLAAEGAQVAIAARTRDQHPSLPGSLHETMAAMASVRGGHALLVTDLSDADDRSRVVPEAVAALGGDLDIVVNNAAAAIYAPVAGYPLKRRRLMFEVNVFAPFDLIDAALPAMRDKGEGWIVNLSSATAQLPDVEAGQTGALGSTTGVYGATKAALDRLTLGLATELKPIGIRCNTVAPRAAVLSEGADALVGSQLSEDQIESMEAMVEAVVALCDGPRERTGRVWTSLDLLDELGITVMDLDGAAPHPGGHRRSLAGG